MKNFILGLTYFIFFQIYCYSDDGYLTIFTAGEKIPSNISKIHSLKKSRATTIRLIKESEGSYQSVLPINNQLSSKEGLYVSLNFTKTGTLNAKIRLLWLEDNEDQLDMQSSRVIQINNVRANKKELWVNLKSLSIDNSNLEKGIQILEGKKNYYTTIRIVFPKGIK